MLARDLINGWGESHQSPVLTFRKKMGKPVTIFSVGHFLYNNDWTAKVKIIYEKP